MEDGTLEQTEAKKQRRKKKKVPSTDTDGAPSSKVTMQLHVYVQCTCIHTQLHNVLCRLVGTELALLCVYLASFIVHACVHVYTCMLHVMPHLFYLLVHRQIFHVQ